MNAHESFIAKAPVPASVRGSGAGGAFPSLHEHPQMPCAFCSLLKAE
jgi:hypothetical protein